MLCGPIKNKKVTLTILSLIIFGMAHNPSIVDSGRSFATNVSPVFGGLLVVVFL